MVVDDEIAVIATFNLDPRSANLNTECLTIIRDARVAESVRRAIDIDMQPENAWHVTRELNWRSRFERTSVSSAPSRR